MDEGKQRPSAACDSAVPTLKSVKRGRARSGCWFFEEKCGGGGGGGGGGGSSGGSDSALSACVYGHHGVSSAVKRTNDEDQPWYKWS